MMKDDSKRYYWLKMGTNFFDNHKLRSLSMFEHGREAQLLYVKLLVESVPHNGELRNSKDIPYSEMMIAGFTYTPVEIVKTSLKLLEDVGLIVRMKDGTITFLELDEMVGSESGQTIRKNRYRSSEEVENTTEIPPQVVISTTESGKEVVKSTIEYKSTRDKSIDNKNICGGGSTPARPRKEITDYPETFQGIVKHLESAHISIMDESALLAKFIALKKNGWKDGNNRTIRDWKAFFERMAQKQACDCI